MSTEVQGDVELGYGVVADEFLRNFAERKELGAACAVVRDGKLVVDLWGGHRDSKRTKPWRRDTLVTVWSTTKGMSAAAMTVARSCGLFDVDERIAAYWPEFAQAGKEAITVRQPLEHEAGLAVIDYPDTRIVHRHTPMRKSPSGVATMQRTGRTAVRSGPARLSRVRFRSRVLRQPSTIGR